MPTAVLMAPSVRLNRLEPCVRSAITEHRDYAKYSRTHAIENLDRD